MSNEYHDDQTPEPMDADAYFYQSVDYGLVGAYDEEIEALTKAIQLNPTNAKYYYRRASAHFIKSRWADALPNYTEAIRLKPDPNDDDVWNFTLAEAYQRRAITYRYLEDYEASLADFAEVIGLEPDNPHHYLDRSVIYKIKGDYANSTADVHTLQRLDPNNPVALGLLAHIELLQGNKKAAMAHYDEQVERFGHAASYLYRGQLWKEMGNLPKAIADFEGAIRVLPSDKGSYVKLAQAYYENGEFEKTLGTLKTLMYMTDDYNFVALLLVARAQRALGNKEQANEAFEATIATNTETINEYPQFANGYAMRGQAYAAQGRTAEAIADYKRALELDPNQQDAQMMRDYLAKNA